MKDIKNLFVVSGFFWGKEKNYLNTNLNLQEKFIYEILIPKIETLNEETDSESALIFLGNLLFNKYIVSSISFYKLSDLLSRLSKVLPVYIVLSDNDIIYKKNEIISILNTLNLYNVYIIKDYMDVVFNGKHIRFISYNKDYQVIRNYLYESNKMKYDIVMFAGDIEKYINYLNKPINISDINLICHLGDNRDKLIKISNLFFKEQNYIDSKENLGFYIISLREKLNLFFVENEILPKSIVLDYTDFIKPDIINILKNKYCFIKIKSSQERDEILKIIATAKDIIGYEFIDDEVIEHISSSDNIEYSGNLEVYLKEYLEIYVKDELLRNKIFEEIKKGLYD